ncbi:MAG: DNA primase [Candidatus Omnitrophica bacterium]|nr:DNA primase [Candidatus Omnitrophota bacterium]
MSNDPVVNQVAQLNDIVEIVSGYIPLKKAGRHFKACCPFHPEKTPSFMVNSERQIFHCFGCGAGGDVFSFVMKIENASFPEALQKLADRVHVILPKRGTDREGQEGKSRKEKLYEIAELAAQFYARNYNDPTIGAVARGYMGQRGFDSQVLEQYRVGYATDGWQSLTDYLSKKGYSQELLYASGLISKNRDGRPFDLFRKRVIFPILSAQGRVIAFGGRALSNADTPKYLNSPESEIFKKRDELYGLNQAKKHVDPDKSQFFVCEGYLDLIRLVQSGFLNSVATLGTALTVDHCRLMRRYVMEAVLVYDGDRAGESASIRGIDVFLEEGMNVKLLSLPAGLDPDDFLKEKGRGSFEGLLSKAQDIFEFKLAHLLKRFNPKDTVGLVRISNEFLEMLAKVKNSVLVDRYLKRLGGVLGIDENSLKKEFLKLQSKSSPDREKDWGKTRDIKNSSKPQAKFLTHEWTLISLAIRGKKFIDLLLKNLEAQDFQDQEAGAVFKYISGNRSGTIALGELLEQVRSEAGRSLLSNLAFFDLSEEENEIAFEDCVFKMKNQSCADELSSLLSKMKQAEASGEEEKVSEYLRQYQTLVVKKKSL